jgi:pyruvate dehydrogenase E2 component (dihydrolipoamide acetyltransferase)
LVVETDKAQVDVESPEEGILLKIVAEPGTVLNTGDLVAYVGNEGETI